MTPLSSSPSESQQPWDFQEFARQYDALALAQGGYPLADTGIDAGTLRMYYEASSVTELKDFVKTRFQSDQRMS